DEDADERDRAADHEHARIDDDCTGWIRRAWDARGHLAPHCSGLSAMLKGMSLRGALSTMSGEDVLEWVAKRKLSAPITFERRGLVRSLVVEEGAIVWASSNRRDEQLGVVLVRSGLVAER